MQANLSAAEARRWRANLRYQRAVFLVRSGRGAEARADFEEAEAGFSPAADPDALMRRGRARAALGKFDLADQDFATALLHQTRPRLGLGSARRRAPAGR